MKTLTVEKTASEVRSHSVDKGIIILLTSAALIGILYVLTQNNPEFETYYRMGFHQY